MWKAKSLIGSCIALAGVAWACGPWFPNQLLDNREATLKGTPRNGFAFEVAHLIRPDDALKPNELKPWQRPADDDKEAIAQLHGLSLDELERVAALRLADDGITVYEKSEGLPEDLRWYTAAVVDYARTGDECGAGIALVGDHPCHGRDPAAMQQAIEEFEQVLALPPEQAMRRSVWAAYMLGRAHTDLARRDIANFAHHAGIAAQAYQVARDRARAGASDPQGLAVASYGEEARLHLHVRTPVADGSSDGPFCRWQGFIANWSCPGAIAGENYVAAMHLYAEQAARGSNSGVQSLRFLTGYAFAHPALLQPLIADPLAQRIVVAYALAYSTDDDDDAGAGRFRHAHLATLVDAIEQQGVPVAGGDRLAALAYRVGRYNLAEMLAAKSKGPLAVWVRAKLALQRGDLAAAAEAYATVSAAFPQADSASAVISPGNEHLLTGERGVLALARGEYLEAMQSLYTAALAGGDGAGDGLVIALNDGDYDYAADASYVAERVLTLDELKSFVDDQVKATPAPEANSENYYSALPYRDRLRWLLARRLLRAGHYREALPYFPATADPRTGFGMSLKEPELDLREQARAYAEAVDKSRSAWTDIGKAEAMYAAAVIARRYGMELMGFEQSPDYADTGGNIGISGHSADDLKGMFVTEEERQRFNASIARPDLRFHYRFVAVDHASAAADLLPSHSQAFAAVLCKATGWMMNGPPDYAHTPYDSSGKPGPDERAKRVRALYARYVEQGPYVVWAADFGRNCQDPDFDSARKLRQAERIIAFKHAIRDYLPYGMGAFILFGVGVIIFAIRRRLRNLLYSG
ncbi:MAG: hypothetical protein LBL59_08015 [Xanthomonadaceae bacterium]|jgi:hypothetical protein|nr:hypothetical protein [Xanthomonadaceae bacterium]